MAGVTVKNQLGVVLTRPAMQHRPVAQNASRGATRKGDMEKDSGLSERDEALLNAPCIFCGYDGQGYWQAGTHASNCPWANIGSSCFRENKLRKFIQAELARLRGENENLRDLLATANQVVAELRQENEALKGKINIAKLETAREIYENLKSFDSHKEALSFIESRWPELRDGKDGE